MVPISPSPSPRPGAMATGLVVAVLLLPAGSEMRAGSETLAGSAAEAGPAATVALDASDPHRGARPAVHPSPSGCRVPLGPQRPGASGVRRAATAPKRVEMTATPQAPGARGTMIVRMAASPYGVAVDPDGSYRLRVEITVEGLRSRGGAHHVAWAATPELDRHVRLGTLGADGRIAGEVAWNKFLVFVTAEAAPAPERWSQEILLSALSPSGRMHTMAGHGPFSGEPCLDPRS